MKLLLFTRTFLDSLPKADHLNDAQMNNTRSVNSSPVSVKSQVDEGHRNYMPLLELSSTFDKFEAGLRKQDLTSPLSVQLVLSQKRAYSPKTLLWGDYVRLKFMLSSKQTGYFYCDHTIIGASPIVFCRIVNTNNQYERESFQAIFKIMPLSDDLYGTPVTFENSKEVFMRLRHLLTGRYLQINSANTKCSLSKSIDEYINNFDPIKDATPSPINAEIVKTQKGKRYRIKEERREILEGLLTPLIIRKNFGEELPKSKS